MTDILERCRGHVAAAKKILELIVAVSGPRTETNTLVPYNQLGVHLDAAGSLAGLIQSVHPEKVAREAAELCEKEVSEFTTELSLDRRLYDAIAAVEVARLDAGARRLVTKLIQDFRRSGVDKDEATRQRVKRLNEELVEVSQDFSRNIREDVRAIEVDSAAELAGLPEDYVVKHQPGADGKIRITTDYPDLIPFMAYARSGEARRRLSTEFKNRGYPKNEPVFARLLARRHELAGLLGYASWAAYVTEDKMIRSAAAVERFIEEIATISMPRAEREYAELLAAKRRDEPGASRVEDWEKGYYEEVVKLEKYSFDSKAARSYFEFGRVKQGLLDLTGELFGLRYEPVLDPEVWHGSVEVHDVRDSASGKTLGRIYLDLHPRADKYKHAAQFTVRSGVAGAQLPEGALVCNFPDPAGGPALMEHGDVVTFFHEFGHLLHHVLGGHQKWIKFSGVATEWDFVEAPSQLFEEWAWDAKVLQRFARHAETGAPIPEALVEKMRAAHEFGQGFAARQQMFYAALSLFYHNQDPSKLAPLEMLKATQGRYGLFPYQEGTHFYLSFDHLNGYSAMYYTYMWSQVIAKDLLSEFKSKGMMNKALSLRYRRTVLEPGGSRDAADLTDAFLGRPYSFDAFRTWLDSART